MIEECRILPNKQEILHVHVPNSKKKKDVLNTKIVSADKYWENTVNYIFPKKISQCIYYMLKKG